MFTSDMSKFRILSALNVTTESMNVSRVKKKRNETLI